MMMTKTVFLLTIVLAILPTTGFGDLSVGVSCGDGFSDMASAVTYGEGTISASQNLIANPREGISNHFYFQGSLPGASSSYSDTLGNYVRLYRSVSGDASTYGSWDWTIANSGPGVLGQLWMNAYKAKLIYAEASAVNGEGDKAKSAATISSIYPVSSLSNYYAKAYADRNTASTAQSADVAKGDTINFDTYASNKEGDMAESYTSATKGDVKSYSANAYSRWYEAYAALDSMKANVPSGSITQKMYATKYDRTSPSYTDTSESKEYLRYGSMTTESANGFAFLDTAYASKYYDIAKAYSSADFNRNFDGTAYSFASARNNPLGGSLSTTLYAPNGLSSFNAFGLTGAGPYKNVQVSRL